MIRAVTSSGSPAANFIEADIDVYGQYARASALADYLEVAALAGHRVTQAALEDLIVDNEWVRRPKRQFLSPDDPHEDPATWVDAVFNMITERENQLGELYPFEQYRRRIRVRNSGFDFEKSPYLSLLAITVVHAWKLASSTAPEPTLEAVVAGVMEAKGLTAVNVGATDRGSGFKVAVTEAGRTLGLRPMDEPKPRSRFAKDAGVDTIAGIVWRDGRPAGQWLMIGQVTVAQSQEWKVKLTQPEAARWARFMQEPLAPQVFLAVPHHAQEEHVRDLLVSGRGLIIDRLRLTPDKPTNTTDEIAIIQTMLSTAVT